QDVASAIELAHTIPDFFPDLLNGSHTQQLSQLREAEEFIAGKGTLKEFYATLRSPNPAEPFPCAQSVDEHWAIYRWLQVRFMFALDLHVRYQGKIPDSPSPKTSEKFEHDVL